MSCPCHPDINDAIAAHRHLIPRVAKSLAHHNPTNLYRTPGNADWDDLLSDGQLALWKALNTYDPNLGDLTNWLGARIRFGLIDGIRSRTGRGAAAKQTFKWEDRDNNVPCASAWEDRDEAIDAAAAAVYVTAIAPTIDRRLPDVLALLAQGKTQTEAALICGLSRTTVWRMRNALAQQLTELRISA